MHPVEHKNRLDGKHPVIWDPIWQLQTELQPVERDLLCSAPLRRLHFLHLNGPAYIHTQYTNTRLQHTLGVFSLIVHLCPDNTDLRVAALLHDIGHAPFSHMLESLDLVDHHQWTIRRLDSAPIKGILLNHRIEPATVLKYISGNPANPLRNQNGIVHADHFDSWVRNGQTIGSLPLSASEIRDRVLIKNGSIEMDSELALIVMKLIYLEAQLHCSHASLGTQTILRRLVQQLLDEGAISGPQLFDMTDSTLEHLLRTTPSTQHEANRLWYSPEDLIVQKLETVVQPNTDHTVCVDSLYVSLPMVDGQPVDKALPETGEILNKIDRLRGQYLVRWAD